MKNEIINILAPGDHELPIGTKLRQFNNGALCNEKSIQVDNFVIASVTNTSIVNEVDFSELPPLYPTPDMIVPEEGIEFVIDGKLLMIDKNRIAWVTDDGKLGIGLLNIVVETEDWELKRTLPKIIEVCSGCFKTVCECVREEGWYRVYVKFYKQWSIRFYDGTDFRVDDGGPLIADQEKAYTEIDWANPINVKPEGES